MSTETLPRPVDMGTSDDDPAHYYCRCTPDVGICGADLTGLEEADDDDGPECVLCVVLLEASDGLCGRCGQ